MPLTQLVAELSSAAETTAGYSRTLFKHWIDEDGDGCDTREEVLIQESTVAVTQGSGCTVIGGQWDSWYDGKSWTSPSDVDIDHLVPLSEAWKSGAYSWTADQRMAYANDLDLDVALEAVTDSVNQSKGDRDPAQWMPPLADAATQCQYVTDWAQVKYRWSLTVDPAERSKLTEVASGSCGASLVTVPTKADTTTQPALAPVTRLAGADRYATAVAISAQYASGVPVLYVATGKDYPDALSAAPAAASLGGPLLLTQPTSLPAAVNKEITRLHPARIVVVGGTAAVSAGVYKQLAALAPAIRRDAGADRYETSRVINQRAFAKGAASAFFATGANYPDALSASAAAGSAATPVVLVKGQSSTLDAKTQALVSSLGVSKAKIAGGTAAISTNVEKGIKAIPGVTTVTRFAGADRYQTSEMINRASFTTSPKVYMAVGTGFADALAGAALAGRDHAALFVVPGKCVPADVVNDLTTLGTAQRVLLGGTAVLGSGVEKLTVCAAAPQPTPKPKPTPKPTPTPSNPGDSKNCSDFATWADANAWYQKYYPYYGDIAKLDGNKDGIVCESLPGAPKK